MPQLEVLEADVTKLDVDAIANAANTGLMHGGGVAGLMVGVARAHEGELERIVFAVHGADAERAFREALG